MARLSPAVTCARVRPPGQRRDVALNLASDPEAAAAPMPLNRTARAPPAATAGQDASVATEQHSVARSDGSLRVAQLGDWRWEVTGALLARAAARGAAVAPEQRACRATAAACA